MDVEGERIVAVLVGGSESACLMLYLLVGILVQRLNRRHIIEGTALLDQAYVFQAALARAASRTVAKSGQTTALLTFEEVLVAEFIIVSLLVKIRIRPPRGRGRTRLRRAGEGSVRWLVISAAEERLLV